MLTHFEVPYPPKHSEADVVFALAFRLDRLGYDFKQEVSLKLQFQRSCRFDIVVYNIGKAKVIIEVKDSSTAPASKAAYYREVTGLPVVVCRGMKDVNRAVEEIEYWFDK